MPSTSSIPIDEHSSLADIQAYIWQTNIDRGFDDESPEQKMVLLTEEVGEVARAVRKLAGVKFDNSTNRSNLDEEIADVFIVLSGLASMTGIDLLTAVVEKEKKNSQRTWQ